MEVAKLFKRVGLVRVDHRVEGEAGLKATEAESAVALCRVAEEKKIVRAGLGATRKELARRADLEQSRHERAAELPVLVMLWAAASALAVFSNYWGLDALALPSDALRWVLAATLPVVAMIGGLAVGLSRRREMALIDSKSERTMRFGAGFTILALAVLATIVFTTLRGIDAYWLEEKQRQIVELRGDADLAADSAPKSPPRPLLAALFALWSMLLGVAGELGAAWIFDRLLVTLLAVASMSALRRRASRLEHRWLDLVTEEERARHAPNVARARIQRETLNVEAVTATMIATTQNEHEGSRGAEAPRNALPSRPTHSASRRQSRTRLAVKILAVIFATAAAVLLVVYRVQSAELPCQSVVLLDLSTSSTSEFEENIRAVDGLLQRMREPGHRVAVLAITEASFQTKPLLVTTSPRDPGRYGDAVVQWLGATRGAWGRLRSTLKPKATESDIFGATARASVEFADRHTRCGRLIFLSDMRQVGRGINLERPIRDPSALAVAVERAGLIPRLADVEVWALGVHTDLLSEQAWFRLRDFWTEYFRRSGATLKRFSPGRVLGE